MWHRFCFSHFVWYPCCFYDNVTLICIRCFVKSVIFIALFGSLIVNDTKHDYNITVKVTETYTRHQTVTPTLKVLSLEYLKANYMHKLSSAVNKFPSIALNSNISRCCKRSNVLHCIIASFVNTYIVICQGCKRDLRPMSQLQLCRASFFAQQKCKCDMLSRASM